MYQNSVISRDFYSSSSSSSVDVKLISINSNNKNHSRAVSACSSSSAFSSCSSASSTTSSNGTFSSSLRRKLSLPHATSTFSQSLAAASSSSLSNKVFDDFPSSFSSSSSSSSSVASPKQQIQFQQQSVKKKSVVRKATPTISSILRARANAVEYPRGDQEEELSSSRIRQKTLSQKLQELATTSSSSSSSSSSQIEAEIEKKMLAKLLALQPPSSKKRSKTRYSIIDHHQQQRAEQEEGDAKEEESKRRKSKLVQEGAFSRRVSTPAASSSSLKIKSENENLKRRRPSSVSTSSSSSSSSCSSSSSSFPSTPLSCLLPFSSSFASPCFPFPDGDAQACYLSNQIPIFLSAPHSTEMWRTRTCGKRVIHKREKYTAELVLRLSQKVGQILSSSSNPTSFIVWDSHSKRVRPLDSRLLDPNHLVRKDFARSPWNYALRQFCRKFKNNSIKNNENNRKNCSSSSSSRLKPFHIDLHGVWDSSDNFSAELGIKSFALLQNQHGHPKEEEEEEEQGSFFRRIAAEELRAALRACPLDAHPSSELSATLNEDPERFSGLWSEDVSDSSLSPFTYTTQACLEGIHSFQLELPLSMREALMCDLTFFNKFSHAIANIFLRLNPGFRIGSSSFTPSSSCVSDSDFEENEGKQNQDEEEEKRKAEMTIRRILSDCARGIKTVKKQM